MLHKNIHLNVYHEPYGKPKRFVYAQGETSAVATAEDKYKEAVAGVEKGITEVGLDAATSTRLGLEKIATITKQTLDGITKTGSPTEQAAARKKILDAGDVASKEIRDNQARYGEIEKYMTASTLLKAKRIKYSAQFFALEGKYGRGSVMSVSSFTRYAQDLEKSLDAVKAMTAPGMEKNRDTLVKETQEASIDFYRRYAAEARAEFLRVVRTGDTTLEKVKNGSADDQDMNKIQDHRKFLQAQLDEIKKDSQPDPTLVQEVNAKIAEIDAALDPKNLMLVRISQIDEVLARVNNPDLPVEFYDILLLQNHRTFLDEQLDPKKPTARVIAGIVKPKYDQLGKVLPEIRQRYAKEAGSSELEEVLAAHTREFADLEAAENYYNTVSKAKGGNSIEARAALALRDKLRDSTSTERDKSYALAHRINLKGKLEFINKKDQTFNALKAQLTANEVPSQFDVDELTRHKAALENFNAKYAAVMFDEVYTPLHQKIDDLAETLRVARKKIGTQNEEISKEYDKLVELHKASVEADTAVDKAKERGEDVSALQEKAQQADNAYKAQQKIVRDQSLSLEEKRAMRGKVAQADIPRGPKL